MISVIEELIATHKMYDEATDIQKMCAAYERYEDLALNYKSIAAIKTLNTLSRKIAEQVGKIANALEALSIAPEHNADLQDLKDILAEWKTFTEGKKP